MFLDFTKFRCSQFYNDFIVSLVMITLEVFIGKLYLRKYLTAA